MLAFTIDYFELKSLLSFQRVDSSTKIIHEQGANVVTNAHVKHSFNFDFDISLTLRT
jgi:hypothetical protein